MKEDSKQKLFEIIDDNILEQISELHILSKAVKTNSNERTQDVYTRKIDEVANKITESVFKQKNTLLNEVITREEAVQFFKNFLKSDALSNFLEVKGLARDLEQKNKVSESLNRKNDRLKKLKGPKPKLQYQNSPKLQKSVNNIIKFRIGKAFLKFVIKKKLKKQTEKSEKVSGILKQSLLDSRVDYIRNELIGLIDREAKSIVPQVKLLTTELESNAKISQSQLEQFNSDIDDLLGDLSARKAKIEQKQQQNQNILSEFDSLISQMDGLFLSHTQSEEKLKIQDKKPLEVEQKSKNRPKSLEVNSGNSILNTGSVRPKSISQVAKQAQRKSQGPAQGNGIGGTA